MPIVEQKVEALLTRVQREVDAGLLPSCQVALGYEGELVAFETYGDASDDTRYCVFSATKAFVASVIWQLLAERQLDLRAKVVDVIPELGSNGKDVITVEQVLLHTSGFPHAPMPHPLWLDKAARLERMQQWRLNWEPGTRHEYHATSAHWVLAELIDRVTGSDYRVELRRRVLEPLGLRFGLGIPVEEQGDLAELELVGEEATGDELEAVLGIRELPVTEVTDEALMRFNLPEVRALGVPGGGGFGRAADLALFYQALLHDPQGLWDPGVLADATGTVRNTFPDPLLRVTANRGLGVVIAGDDGGSALRGFGKTVSGRAFGHDGAGGQLAFGDPVTGLSLGYVTNGLDRHVLRQGRRGVAIASIAGDCATA